MSVSVVIERLCAEHERGCAMRVEHSATRRLYTVGTRKMRRRVITMVDAAASVIMLRVVALLRAIQSVITLMSASGYTAPASAVRATLLRCCDVVMLREDITRDDKDDLPR